MQKHHLIKRMACVALSLILLLSVFVMGLVPAGATKKDKDNVTKTEKRYEIAVVFDNSGSMYENQSKAWCQAKYAMEIFASMLNYDNGDKLSIFPMWEVTTDTSKPKAGKNYDPNNFEKPIKINGKNDFDKISNLFTVYPAGTPYEPVKEANAYLKSVDDDCEKWLVVLTDGEFNNEARGVDAKINLQDRLLKLATDEIKVQYLGFGKAKELNEDSSNANFHAKKSTAVSLKEDLIEICNSIFQRDELKNALNGSKLTLDVSMRKIIVFAQGSNAKIVSLENAKGKEVKMTLNSGQRTYSKISANDYVKKDGTINKCSEAKPDKTLAGQVVTFDACKAGTYTLNVTGAKAENIKIFYEPDVDIHFELKKNTKTIDLSKEEIIAGKYNAYYSLVDRATGDEVVTVDGKNLKPHIMGEDVTLTGTLVDSKGNKKPFKSEQEIDLQPDSSLYFNIVGRYLNDYTITTDSDKEGFTYKVIAEVDDLDIKAKCKQKSNWYNLQKKDEWQPIYVSVKVNGKPVSDEKLKSMKMDFTCKDLTYTTKMLPGKSAYEIYVGKNEKGEFVKPENGIYTMSVKGSYIDNYDRHVEGEDSVPFEIQPYSQIWRWLIYVVIFAVLLALFLFFMSRKVLPKKLKEEKNEFFVRRKNIGSGTAYYDRKAKTLTLESMIVPSDHEAECSATFKLYPVDKRWTRSKKRRIGICDVTYSSSGVNRIKVDGLPLEMKDEKFVMKSAPNAPLQLVMSTRPRISVESKRNSYLKVDFSQS